MSFILDALKKAEDEKNAKTPPELTAAVTAPPRNWKREQAAAQQRLILIAGGSLLLVLLVGLGLWLHGRPKSNAAASAPAAVAATAPAAAPTPPPASAGAPVPAAAPAPAAPAPAPAPEQAALAEPQITQGVAEDDDNDGESAPIAPGEAGAEAASMDDLVGDESQMDNAPPAPEAGPEPSEAEISALSKPVTPVPPPAAAPRRKSATVNGNAGGNSRGNDGEPKPLRDMPASFRTNFPQLSVDVHYYDENPLRRFVIVNGRKYRETDTLVEGPKVIEITPTGVILDKNGTRVVKGIPR